MSDALSIGLTQQEKARSISPGKLEEMGKKAAAAFTGVSSLSECVVAEIKEASLSPEQIKRVCEFANTEAYLNRFAKMGSVRTVTFEGGPASPSTVIQCINDGASHTLSHSSESSDYSKHYGSYKTASAHDVLQEAFGVTDTQTEKVAAAEEVTQASLIQDRETIDRAINFIQDKLAGAFDAYTDASNSILASSQSAVMSGEASYPDLVRAWGTIAEYPAAVKEASALVQQSFKVLGVSTEGSTSKTASVINVGHPAIVAYHTFEKAAQATRTLREAVRVLEEKKTANLKQIRSTLS